MKPYSRGKLDWLPSSNMVIHTQTYFLLTSQSNDGRLLCVVCWSFYNISVANSVDPDQNASLGVHTVYLYIEFSP